MRLPLVLIALAAASTARAQGAAPPAALPPAGPVNVNQTVILAAPPADPGEPILGLDIMIGQLSGIRPHVAISRGERAALVVEAFYGGILTKLGTSEGAGAGVRYNVKRGDRDAVTVGPGADVLFNFRDGQAVIFAPSVDVAWRRDFGDRVGCVLGIQAGVGVGLSGRYSGRDDRSAAGQVTPLISLFGGLRF